MKIREHYASNRAIRYAVEAGVVVSLVLVIGGLHALLSWGLFDLVTRF